MSEVPGTLDTAGAVRRGVRSGLFTLGAMTLAMWVAHASGIDAGAVERLTATARPGRLFGAWALLMSGTVLMAFRWRALMPVRDHVRILPLATFLVSGTLLNHALPGPVGEFFAAAMAGRRYGMTAETALAANAYGRLVGLAMAGVVAGVLFLAADMPVPATVRTWVGAVTACILVVAIGVAVLATRPSLLRRVSGATLGRFHVLAPLHTRVLGLVESLAVVGTLPRGRWLEACAWSLLGHTSAIVGTGMAAEALGGSPDPAGLAFTYTVTTAGAVLLFAFPGTQVGWEAMLTTLLVATAGLSLPVALGVALVIRTQQIATVLLGAVVLPQTARREEDHGARGG
ncbi:MAG: hypothetical protein RLZZ299_647 [Pseudomonadota bacterium]